MESKDLPSDSLAGLRARARVTPLNFDGNSSRLDGEDAAVIAESSASSPSASMSPRTPADSAPLSATEPPPDSPKSDAPREPSSGLQRTRSASSSGSKSGESKEKRKRSRVTPEQLSHLERFFAADRSPTAARRKEISDLLGMQERQTQIWFQNRRAKAKLLDGKKTRHGDWSDTPPDTPPQLSAGFEADLQSLIHEEHPISIIPCTDLSIGTWRRIATPSGKHDLVAYVCEAKRCLTWFIHSAGYGFKMEIPFDSITHTEFRNAAPGEGLASFTLSQPPIFYLEHISSPRASGGVIKTWKRCSDWTEGTQASQVMRHDLIGSAVLLAHVLQDLQRYRTRSNIHLLSLGAYNSPSEGSASGLQIPQPPLASLQTDAYGSLSRPGYLGHSRKRSNSGPPAFTHAASSYVHDFPSISTEPSAPDHNSGPHSAGFATTSFPHLPERPNATLPYTQNFGQRVMSDYISSDFHRDVPIAHSAAHRPYATAPGSHFAFPQGRSSPPFQVGSLQQHSASPAGQSSFLTPSPPHLSPSFHQQAGGSLSGSSLPVMQDIGPIPQPRSQPPALAPLDVPALPSIPYYAHDNLQSQHNDPRSSRSDSSVAMGSLGTSSPSTDMPRQ